MNNYENFKLVAFKNQLPDDQFHDTLNAVFAIQKRFGVKMTSFAKLSDTAGKGREFSVFLQRIRRKNSFSLALIKLNLAQLLNHTSRGFH